MLTSCWYHIFSALDLLVGPRKIQKCYFLSIGPQKHPEWRGITHSGIGAPKVPFSTKMKVKQGQNPHRKKLSIILHQTQASRRFLATLAKFDLVWPGVDLENPKFDPAIRAGWNQSHFEDYKIPTPTNIHRSKSELERLRYHENQDNAPIHAPLTSESHNFWSDCWIFMFHTFLENESQDQIHPRSFTGGGCWRPLPRKVCQGYKNPQTPSKQKKETPLVLCYAWKIFKIFSSLPNTKNTRIAH